MKKLLLFLVLALPFGACKKEKKAEEPAPVQNLYPKTVSRTVNFNTDVTTTRFAYDAANRISREEVFYNDILNRSGLYLYNTAGNLVGKNYYVAGKLTEQNDYLLDAAGRPVKLSHHYVDDSGLATLHHFRTFEYTAAGQIAKVTDFTPGGQIMGGIFYEHIGEEFIKTVSFGPNGALVSNNEVAFDQHHHPFAFTANHNNGLLHNEISQTQKDPGGTMINAIHNNIFYNPENYPVKIIQTQSNGLVLTETFTY